MITSAPPFVHTIVDILAHHNAFATRRLIEACRGLSEAQLTQRFDIGPGSVHGAILHIIGAMRRWADRINDREIRPSIEEDRRTRTVDELLVLLDEAAADLQDVVCAVRREKRIDEMMEVVIRGRAEPYRFTRGTAIVHIFTHGAHHRAQALNMLRQLGITPLPELDAVEAELAAADKDGAAE